jgi:RNA polymerase sigma factor (sigma-70 family)
LPEKSGQSEAVEALLMPLAPRRPSLMTRTAASPILHLIRRVVEDQRLKDLPDQELLRCFLAERDQAAFDALLRRHGSMVFDVCRNVLGNEQGAEDAFQATFLVLAQKAAAIRKKSSVGSWLYGVAYRTANKARSCSAKRRKHEARVPRLMATTPADDISWREIRQLLYSELNRLPECYRAPVVLCYLEENSQQEAARFLGISRGTLQRRLDAGRALLRTRLVRRGLGPAAILAISTWPSTKVSGLVPFGLLDSTVKASVLIGAGEAARGVISPKVLALTEGVLKAMFLSKLRLVSAMFLAVSISAGLAGWTYRATAQTGPQGPRFQPQQQGQQEPPVRDEGPGRPARHVRGGPAADELDALRLEIDALRKEVRADRERIKALEAEAHARNEKPGDLYQNAKESEHLNRFSSEHLLNRFPQDKARADERNQPGQQPGNLYQNAKKSESFNRFPQSDAGADKQKQPSQLSGPDTAGTKKGQSSDRMDAFLAPSQRRQRSSDAFAEAESALRKLRQNPRDKQAAQALERATQRLKVEAARERLEDPNSNRPQKH